MSRLAIIRQPAGLGDILFAHKIGHKVIEKYMPDKLIWPVCTQYNWLKEYLNVPSNWYFVDENTEFEGKEIFLSPDKSIQKSNQLLYIPLQFSCDVMREGDYLYNLYAKYEHVGVEYNDWTNYISIKRNSEKETELYNKKINFNEPYIVVNRNYGTISQKRKDMYINTGYKEVELDYEPGYNIFDWILILEKAKEIHTIQTSLAYLLDTLKMKNVKIYHRCMNLSDIKGTSWHTFDYCNKFHNPEWQYEQL
jgi:hypothetical protein